MNAYLGSLTLLLVVHGMASYPLLYAIKEIPWILLFFVGMCLVELQLMYCVPCMRASVKVVEAGILVVALRLWFDPQFAPLEPWADAFKDVLQNHTLR